MKRLILSIGLTISLSIAVMGGEIPSGGSPQPPPTAPGEINTPGFTQDDGSDLADAALSGLLSALGLALL